MKCRIKTTQGDEYGAVFDGANNMEAVLDLLNQSAADGYNFIYLEGYAIVQIAHIVSITEEKEIH